MVMKQYSSLSNMLGAMDGYAFLQRNLPAEERSQIIKDFHPDYENNRVFMEFLSDGKWVVSAGNESEDREHLRSHKLKAIPNFDAVIAKMFDAVEKMGNVGIPIGPDVYFFTIDQNTGRMDYVYADTESAADRLKNTSTERIGSLNLHWLGGTLNLFLHECMEDPAMCLDRVRKEVLSRMRRNPWAKATDQASFLKDFEWPTLDWKQSAVSHARWIRDSVGSFVKGSLQM
jgi:hypothetical protein